MEGELGEPEEGENLKCLETWHQQMEQFKKDYKSCVTKNKNMLQGKYLKEADFEWCKKNTRFDDIEIIKWFKCFRKECPNGILSLIEI